MDSSVTITGAFFPSFYFKDYEKAIAFYTEVLGPPQTDVPNIKGWYLGNTWLTFFPNEKAGTVPGANPQNAEFAIQVATPEEVDILFAAFIRAGATAVNEPVDTEMYDKMRFSCVDDPFGIRVDILCPT